MWKLSHFKFKKLADKKIQEKLENILMEPMKQMKTKTQYTRFMRCRKILLTVIFNYKSTS